MSNEDQPPPLSEQTKRPADTALLQQRVKAWYPILDPWWVIAGFAILGAIFVPVGYYISSESNSAFEAVKLYDAYDRSDLDCGITTANANKSCVVSIDIREELEPPVLIHYEIENFHQNHRAYQQSRDDKQLYGSTKQDAIAAKNCEPLNIIGGIRLNPCGFIANTFFNDIISLENTDIEMIETGIAWQSDIDYVFNQPDDFKKEPCPNNFTEGCCDGDSWSCTEPAKDETDDKYYRYFYPDENTTQYLYETYGDIISPLEGVTNEHFIVWMRVAALPNFRKLYGWINETIPKDTQLNFQIANNWEVTSFKGRKSLVVSKANVFGGKNDYMGNYYFGVGWFCIVVALFFALKQSLRPRRIADPKYLRYKED